MAEIADKICADYKSMVTAAIKNKATSTGEAAASIHVEQISDTRYRIGAENSHLYFFEEGNGSRIIYPVKAKALYYSDGSFHGRSTPYAGRNIKAKVAAKYR